MRRHQTLRWIGATAAAALLAASPATLAASMSSSLASLIPPGPTWVSGYEIAASSGTATFAGSARGALTGSWVATVDGLPTLAPGAPLPSSLQVTGGTLTLSALGTTLTVSIQPGSASLPPGTPGVAPSSASTGSGSAAASSSGGSTAGSTSSGSSASSPSASGAASAATPSAPPTVVPASVAGAEEMLQVLSGVWYAAKGSSQVQQQLAAEAQALVAAYPALSVLGSFPLPPNAVVAPPRPLSPPDTSGCGDVAYQGSLNLSLPSVATGTFTGEVVVYRTETAAGCATYATALSGELTVQPAAS